MSEKEMKPYRDENGKMLKGENCLHNQDGSCQGYKKRGSCGGCTPVDPKIFGDTKNLGLGYSAFREPKVYCQQCKYIRIVRKNTTFGGCPPCVCKHPDNLIESFEDRWYCRIYNNRHKQEPNEINKNNGCKWYKADPQVCIGYKCIDPSDWRDDIK